MDRVLSVTPSAGVMTFTGPLNCLETQSSFDHILGLNSIMIRSILHNKRQYATEDTEYLASKVFTFCNFYRLHVFFDSFQLKYVCTTSYDSQKMLADISLALFNLKIVYK